MIPRLLHPILDSLKCQYPVIAILGPRQSGKTTLAKTAFPELPYLSLEDLDEREIADQDPRGFLKRFSQGAIIDEAQHVPKLFSYLQTYVDLNPNPGRFVLTGSQNFLLHANIAQSLAGRVSIVTLLPFSLQELKNAQKLPEDLNLYLIKGTYPRQYQANIQPDIWAKNYIRTYLERDIRQLKNINDLGKFQIFLKMCAHRVGQLVNLSALGQECGITHNTAKEWLHLLEASYLIFLLKPYYRNYNKRLVKMPKLYFFDTGLVCSLLNIQGDIYTHPMRGALFENLVISEIFKNAFNKNAEPNLYFWRDHIGHEIDALQEQGLQLIPYEIKSGYTLTKESFKGMQYWLKLTAIDKGYLIYAGDKQYTHKNIEVMPWRQIGQL